VGSLANTWDLGRYRASNPDPTSHFADTPVTMRPAELSAWSPNCHKVTEKTSLSLAAIIADSMGGAPKVTYYSEGLLRRI
jgi:hypothetical protein